MNRAQMKRLQRKQQRKQNRLTNRTRAASSADGMAYRSSSIGTVNEQERTVIATLSTEQPVPMYDYRTRGVVDEVLLASGGHFPERMPMLDSHSLGGAGSVRGSIRNPINSGDRWRGTLHFATNAGQEADQSWELVRQGHLTDVSIGYRYTEGDYVDIPPGQSRRIQGREFTANRNRIMRVVTNWSAREASITPIGADDQAKIGRSGGTPENENLSFGYQVGEGNFGATNQRTEDDMNYLAWLHARGMDQAITEQTAALDWARSNLAGDSLNQFTAMCRAENIAFETRAITTTPATTTHTPAAAPVAPAAPQGISTLVETRSGVDSFAEARERAAYITQVGEGIPAEVRQRAIDGAWSLERINSEFQTARAARTEPISGHAPAGHVVNNTLTARALQAAILYRSGIEVDNPLLRSSQAQHVLNDRSLFEYNERNQAGWLVNHSRSLQQGGATRDEQAARAVDQAASLRRMSLVDMCRAALIIEGVQHSSYDTQEIVYRAFSTATLNAVFTTNFAATMLAGFMDAPDTTGGWTSEADLPNFQTVERIQIGKTSKMKRTDRHQKAGDVDAEAVMESYKLHRYAGNFVVDEMDIIDDRFGALDQMAPRDMGEAARVIGPDLVYSILLGNPTMVQDSKALFHTDHGNYVSSGAGLALATLEAAKSSMAIQTSNGRLIDVRAQYLIVPESVSWTAQRMTGSAELRDTTSSTEYGTLNPARGSFTVVSDPRLDVGVADPSSLTGVVHAGQPGSWGLATARGRYGIEKGYLAGTGKAPVVRKYTLSEGRMGIGWTSIMYNAAKAIGYQGLSWQKT